MRELQEFHYSSETHKKILETAIELFAIKGINAVSMRDIAKAVGIKSSSIYYYYEDGKDSLVDDVLLQVEMDYTSYIGWLSSVNAKAESVEELMDNLFNDEFLEVRNPKGYWGMALMLKEQHNNDFARRRVLDMFFDYSIQSIQNDFDRLVKKGIILPTDTKILATIIMSCVMSGCAIHIHERMGYEVSVNCLGIAFVKGKNDYFTKKTQN